MNINSIICINKFLQKLSRLFDKIHLKSLSRIVSLPRHKFCINYIKSKIPNTLNENYYQDNTSTIAKKDFCVFIFWYQGVDKMPIIIKKCYESILANFPSENVILLTKYNLHEYITIPQIIKDKLDNKKMTITSFSDFLRVSLLYEYGGIWIDTTVFLSNKLNDSILSLSFITLPHSNNANEFKYLYQGTKGWSSYFLGSNIKHHPLFLFIKKSYLEYFSNTDKIIDYFFTDYLISIFLSIKFDFKYEIDKIDLNGNDSYLLADKMNKISTKNSFNSYEILLTTCSIHKLTYKRNWKEKIRNKNTIFSDFLKQKFI